MPRKFDEEAYVRKCEEKLERKARQREELRARGLTYNPRVPYELWLHMADLRAIREHKAAVARGEPQSWFTGNFGTHSHSCPICQQKKIM